MKTTPESKIIIQKLFDLQKTLGPVIKDSSNPAFKSKYASLAAVMEAVREPLEAAGLFLTVDVDVSLDKNAVSVTTKVMDVESQQAAALVLTFVLPDLSPQKVGGATSYGKRYGIMTLFGLVAQELEDDANHASGIKPPLTPPKPPVKVVTAVTTKPGV